MNSPYKENPQDLAACRACWEKNPEVPFADFWAGWKAKGEAAVPSKVEAQPVGYVGTQTLGRLLSGQACGIMLEDKKSEYVDVPLFTHSDAGELSQCEAMARMIEEKEWAEHAGTGPVSSRIEAAFTTLHNELSEAREAADTLRAQLTKANYVVERARAIDQAAFANGCANVDIGLFRGLSILLEQYDAALSATKEGKGDE